MVKRSDKKEGFRARGVVNASPPIWTSLSYTSLFSSWIPLYFLLPANLWNHLNTYPLAYYLHLCIPISIYISIYPFTTLSVSSIFCAPLYQFIVNIVTSGVGQDEEVRFLSCLAEIKGDCLVLDCRHWSWSCVFLGVIYNLDFALDGEQLSQKKERKAEDRYLENS